MHRLFFDACHDHVIAEPTIAGRGRVGTICPAVLRADDPWRAVFRSPDCEHAGTMKFWGRVYHNGMIPPGVGVVNKKIISGWGIAEP